MYSMQEIQDLVAGLTGNDLIRKIFEISNSSWSGGYTRGRDDPDFNESEMDNFGEEAND